MTRFALALGLLLVCSISGCDRLTQSPAPKPRPKRPASSVAARPTASQDQSPPAVPSSDHYAVPFAWEKGHDEPLAYARSFISEVLRDNQNYQQRVKPTPVSAVKPQTPRATVVACADSRVLIESWDATPDNDEFVIRNLGNQVATSLGSVQYGVEQLDTPVLFILGHTGCAALGTALQGTGSLSEPIRKDLEALRVSPEQTKFRAAAALNDAVAANVHRQVRLALEKFGQRIVTGRLTVVGAVLDLHDELDKGAGRISIINVNGNSEPRRLRAFVDAIQSQTQVGNKAGAPDGGVGAEPPAEAEANLDPVARDLRAAFSSLAEKVQKQPSHPKHK
jgi:carbonic anhydrase